MSFTDSGLIYRNFQSGDVVSLIQSINGLGGVGKTSIALEYAYRHSHEYETIWWINSENRQTTFSSIRDFALLKGIITDDANEKDILEAMKYWFANNDRWLFIYDNADSGDFNLWLEKFLPKTRNGHVLITTRSNFFPKSESIDITVFTSTEAVLFLKKRTRKSGEGYSDDLAKKLSESLKYLPLALEQAAAYIVETPGVTYQDYIDLYERYGIEIFKKTYLVDYYSTIAITWKISVDKINLNKAGVQMFNMCAYFAPDRIPVEMFVRANRILPVSLSIGIIDDLTKDKIISDLTRYSLISCEKDNSILFKEKRILYMHRLLQEVVKNSFGNDTSWIELCLDLIYEIKNWEKGDKNSFETFKIESTHALTIVESATQIFKEKEKLEKIGNLFSDLGYAYRKQGSYLQALKCHSKALTLRKNIYGEEHLDTASSYNNVGFIYFLLEDHTKALKFLNNALVIRENICSIKHPDIANSYNNIGMVYRSLNDLPQALKHYEKALSINKRAYGENNPETAISYNNVGAIYREQGNYVKALEYYNKSLEIKINVYGEFHPSVGTTYNNIGFLYRALGNNAKALEYYNKDLIICKEVYGEQHPDIAASYNNIASVYSTMRDYDKSLLYFKKAIEIKIKFWGEFHPDTAISYSGIGSVYFELGDQMRALTYYDKAFAIFNEYYGEEHPRTKNVKKRIEILRN